MVLESLVCFPSLPELGMGPTHTGSLSGSLHVPGRGDWTYLRHNTDDHPPCATESHPVPRELVVVEGTRDT